MKKLLFVGLVVLGCCGFAAADLLEGFESPTTTWVVYGSAGGSLLSIADSTEDPFVGERSLKFVDTNVGQPYVKVDNGNYGDLSSLNSTYIELALKTTGTYPSFGTDAFKFYFGNSETARTCWLIRESMFQNVAPDANGWYVIHLALDSGSSTMTGTTLNGVEVTDGVAWNSGTVNWTDIDFMAVLVSQASGSYEWTSYIDQITINEAAVPEPMTMALLGVGGLFVIRRRK